MDKYNHAIRRTALALLGLALMRACLGLAWADAHANTGAKDCAARLNALQEQQQTLLPVPAIDMDDDQLRVVANCYEGEKNLAQQFVWMLALAERGDVVAQYGVSRMYWFGEGVSKDDAQSVRWREAAIAQADAKTQRTYALYVLKGDVYPQSSKQAAHWLQVAAAKGDALAQYHLGRLHLEGKGVKQSGAQCGQWAQQALDGNHTPAAALLAQCAQLAKRQQAGDALKGEDQSEPDSVAIRDTVVDVSMFERVKMGPLLRAWYDPGHEYLMLSDSIGAVDHCLVPQVFWNRLAEAPIDVRRDLYRAHIKDQYECETVDLPTYIK